MTENSDSGSAAAQALARRRFPPIEGQFVDFVGPFGKTVAESAFERDHGRPAGPADWDAVFEYARSGALNAMGDLAERVWNAAVRDVAEPSARAGELLLEEARSDAPELLDLVQAMLESKRRFFGDDLRIMSPATRRERRDEARRRRRDDAAPARRGRIHAEPVAWLHTLPAGHRVLRSLLHPSLEAALTRARQGVLGLAVAQDDAPPSARHDVVLERGNGVRIAWRARDLDALATGTVPAWLTPERPPEVEPLRSGVAHAIASLVHLLGTPPSDDALMRTLEAVRCDSARPSGDVLFDVTWQNLALALAMGEYSRAELDAVLLGYEGMLRGVRDGPESRNLWRAVVRQTNAEPGRVGSPGSRRRPPDHDRPRPPPFRLVK